MRWLLVSDGRWAGRYGFVTFDDPATAELVKTVTDLNFMGKLVRSSKDGILSFA
jgi:hypothetical protein